MTELSSNRYFAPVPRQVELWAAAFSSPLRGQVIEGLSALFQRVGDYFLTGWGTSERMCLRLTRGERLQDAEDLGWKILPYLRGMGKPAFGIDDHSLRPAVVLTWNRPPELEELLAMVSLPPSGESLDEASAPSPAEELHFPALSDGDASSTALLESRTDH